MPEVDWVSTLGIIGGLASVLSLIVALYYRKKRGDQKKLVYETTSSVPIAEVTAPDEDVQISVTYTGDRAREESVDSVHLTFLRFANFGYQPIRGEDIAESDPLRVIVDGARTLDIMETGGRREVCNVRIETFERTGEHATATIDFDFLDNKDGGVVKILTDTPTSSVELKGTIIGMPEGIRTVAELGSSTLFGVGCISGFIFQLAALGAVPFAYNWIMGTWDNIWILLLPLGALVVPILIFGPLLSLIDSDEEFPTGLEVPEWFSSRLSERLDLQRRSLRREMDNL